MAHRDAIAEPRGTRTPYGQVAAHHRADVDASSNPMHVEAAVTSAKLPLPT